MPQPSERAAVTKVRASLAVAAVIIAVLFPVASSAQGGAGSKGKIVMVSIPDRKLAVIEGDDVLATFDVAVGADVSPSPTGEFEIVNRVANPAYYHSGAVVPSGKDNPVGTRWLGLSLKGYGIHGTNAPHSIGQAASHGCIRLRNRDVERLFTMVRVGDVVQIRGERDDEIVQIFGGDDDDEVAEVTQAEQVQSK